MLGRRCKGSVVMDLWSGEWDEFACDLAIVSPAAAKITVPWQVIYFDNVMKVGAKGLWDHIEKNNPGHLRHISFAFGPEVYGSPSAAADWMSLLEALSSRLDGTHSRRLTTILPKDSYEVFFQEFLGRFPESQ